MYLNHKEAENLVNGLKKELKGFQSNYEVVVIPTFTSLYSVAQILDRKLMKLGAQNCYFEKEGAFTGEISPRMLSALGCDYIIVGHSERRKYFCETDDIIARKVKSVLEEGMTPILCVGETFEQREEGKHKEVVESQLRICLSLLSKEEVEKIVIAYEPVWAIGTGKNATPEQAQEMHQFIRSLLEGWFGLSDISILYGGSVKPENIFDLTKMADIDGALVGGASIKLESFIGIIRNAYQGRN